MHYNSTFRIPRKNFVIERRYVGTFPRGLFLSGLVEGLFESFNTRWHVYRRYWTKEDRLLALLALQQAAKGKSIIYKYRFPEDVVSVDKISLADGRPKC